MGRDITHLSPAALVFMDGRNALGAPAFWVACIIGKLFPIDDYHGFLYKLKICVCEGCEGLTVRNSGPDRSHVSW